MIKNNLKEIQLNDCTAYNSDNYSKEKYFSIKYFVKNDRDFVHNKISGLVEKKVGFLYSNIDDEHITGRENFFFHFIFI